MYCVQRSYRINCLYLRALVVSKQHKISENETQADHIRKKYDRFAKSKGLKTEFLRKLNCYSPEYTFKLPPVIFCGKLYLGGITCLLPIP